MSIAIIFDTETTGKHEPQIVEAAWLRVGNDLEVLESFEERYKPSKPIELGALATHHIMDEDLRGCEPSSSFRFPERVAYLIGHHVDYDWEVAGRPDVKRICTCALSRYLWPQIDSHTQSALLYFLYRDSARESLRGAHGALQDVTNCRAILSRIIKQLIVIGEPVSSWEELWQASEKARIPTVMPFGKHQGTAIKDLPFDYVRWMLRQPDMDPYVIMAVRQAHGI